jgi:hypothetical protein
LDIADHVLVGGKLGLMWDEIPTGNLVLAQDYVGEDKDIGEKTIGLFSDIISSAKTILWGECGKTITGREFCGKTAHGKARSLFC